ncbi:MAG TPA: phosphoenolpyruvate synthase [Kofleriaceae bacterium]|nr:phosphoenolpyruvate synthase [Kofleriaceae bacterium]
MAIIRWFRDVGLSDIGQVGGKNANLGELVRGLAGAGVRVPDGFALSQAAFRQHLEQAGLDTEIYAALDDLDTRDVAALARVAHVIRGKIRAATLAADIEQELTKAYEELSRHYGEVATDVAVRSSATAEDLPEASFAGQQESYLNVKGPAALVDAVKACMASLFTDRAIVYRAERGYSHRSVGLSVGIQKMVRSDLACAGVIFTLDTETGFRDVIEITGSWGLGETVVKGEVNPDEITIHKPTLAHGYRPILRRDIGDKAVKLIYATGGNGMTRQVQVSTADRRRLVIDDNEALQLARWALAIEAYYRKPMDIEWAKDGKTGDLFIVQARPETVYSQRTSQTLELYRLKGKGTVRVTGKSVGQKVGTGRVRVIHDASELPSFIDGEILVAGMTDPDWEPVLKHAAAVITDQGGRTCHAAIVARELGIPCIVGTGNATRTLATGETVTVSCVEGDEGRVYAGNVPFTRDVVDPTKLPAPRVPVMLNVGNPENAFQLGQLPSAGVGLARIEFIISSHIGIHPMALLHPERVDRAALATIRERLAGADPSEFFVDGLATGIARIAAGFYPRPVIVRFSDFKTNEYANLLGGAAFEPVEANPMIGFRGASRYYDPRYREGFALECAAIKRVREVMGLTNVKVMIPFCRTLEEARRVQQEMATNGLHRGNGFECWVMCEIPNNVILAAEFSKLFDGFSIGSNDLTQLTLGVDRDSQLLSHLFDEQDAGVKALIAQVVRVAHENGRKVGLCGQAPSDHPEFAEYLASIGIDSMSVTPDALAAVVTTLAK